jgi:hypothetical protein
MILASAAAARFFVLGAVAGLLPLFADALLTEARISPRTVAAFALTAGLVGGLSHALARPCLGARRSATLSVATVAVLVAAEVAFAVNVAVFPTSRFFGPRDLAASLAVCSLLAGGALALRRVLERYQAIRHAWPWLGAMVAICASCVVALAPLWPREETPARRHGRGPDLLVVVLDAVRPDHMSLNGYPRPTTRSLETFATQGRVFKEAFAASSWTLDSVRVLLGDVSTDAGTPRVLEELVRAGYVTACFSDNLLFDRGGPLANGFDYIGHSSPRLVRFLQAAFSETTIGEFALRWWWMAHTTSDARLVDGALSWAARQEGPFLLYVHLMDAHQPYKGPAIDGRSWRERRLETPRSGMTLSDAEKEDVIAFYDGGLRNADAAAGRLLAACTSWGRPVLTVVTADHGANLGEDGRWRHADSLAPHLLRVPMMVLGAGVHPGVAPGPVGHASVARTLLAAADRDCGDCPGVDLRESEAQTLIRGRLGKRLKYALRDNLMVVSDVESRLRRVIDFRDNSQAASLIHMLPQGAAGGASSADVDGLPRATRELLHTLGYLGS